MPIEIPDLWPAEVEQTGVLTPLAILAHQAVLLRRRSGSVLEAEVVSTSGQVRDLVTLALDVIVPALGGYRLRLLTVNHGLEAAYPAWAQLGTGATPTGPGAESQDEFVDQLGKLLRSGRVRATIQSLMAQVNEAKAEVAMR